jgi:hypothetical protein
MDASKFFPALPSGRPQGTGGIACDVNGRYTGAFLRALNYRAERFLCLPRLLKPGICLAPSERLTARFRPAGVVPGRGRAKLRLSRGFPVGFATTREPTVPLRFQLAAAMVEPANRLDQVSPNAPGTHGFVSGHTKAWYEPDAAVQLGAHAFWAKRP